MNISQAARNSKRIRPMRHFRTRNDKKRIYISQRRTVHAKASNNGEKGENLPESKVYLKGLWAEIFKGMDPSVATKIC